MTAAVGTRYRAAGDSTETKNCTQEKAGCWQQDMKINKLVLPRKKMIQIT